MDVMNTAMVSPDNTDVTITATRTRNNMAAYLVDRLTLARLCVDPVDRSWRILDFPVWLLERVREKTSMLFLSNFIFSDSEYSPYEYKMHGYDYKTHEYDYSPSEYKSFEYDPKEYKSYSYEPKEFKSRGYEPKEYKSHGYEPYEYKSYDYELAKRGQMADPSIKVSDAADGPEKIAAFGDRIETYARTNGMLKGKSQQHSRR